MCNRALLAGSLLSGHTNREDLLARRWLERERYKAKKCRKSADCQRDNVHWAIFVSQGVFVYYGKRHAISEVVWPTTDDVVVGSRTLFQK